MLSSKAPNYSDPPNVPTRLPSRQDQPPPVLWSGWLRTAIARRSMEYIYFFGWPLTVTLVMFLADPWLTQLILTGTLT